MLNKGKGKTWVVLLTETVLIDVVHGIMPIPSSNNKHRVLADNCSVPKPIQRLRSLCLNFSPLELVVLQCALVEVIEASVAIVAAEAVHGAFVEHDRVVCADARLVPLCVNLEPVASVQVKVKHVIKVLSSLALVSTKEIQPVHVGHTTHTRPWLRRFSLVFDEIPLVSSHTVAV